MFSAILVSLAVVFVAELGDKSQLITMTYSLRHRWWVVLSGVAVASIMVHGLSVAIGHYLGMTLPERPIAFAASTWVAAYGIQPSKTLCQPFANVHVIKNNVQPVFLKMLETSSKPARRAVERIPMLAKTDPTRLTVALAESLTLRAFIKPITFGGKLWVTYEFMKFVKRKSDEGTTEKMANKKNKVASVSLSLR